MQILVIVHPHPLIFSWRQSNDCKMVPPGHPADAPHKPGKPPQGKSEKPKTSEELTTDKLLQGLSKAEAKNVAALAFSAQEQKVQRKKDKSSSRNWRIATILTLLGIVGFVAGNIFIRKYQYPALFKWYRNMRKEKVQGNYTQAPSYSMYQVTTVMQFEPVGYMLSLFTIWRTLPRAGAEFLAQCVTMFGDRLTSLHWSGSASQTNADKLIGPTGWASSGCPNEGLTAEQLKTNLTTNWIASGAQKNKDGTSANIWHDIFMNPAEQPEDFLNLCVFKELWEPDGSQCVGGGALVEMCTGDNQSYKMSHIWMLFDGGLCNVAFQHTDTEISAQGLFAYYFESPPEVPMNCGASYAAGAVSGATGACSGMLGVAAMATGPAFLIASVGLTVGAGVAGAITGGMASKEACENKAAQQ